MKTSGNRLQKTTKRKNKCKRLLSGILCAALTITAFSGSYFVQPKQAEAKEVTLSSPRTVSDNSMKAGQKVTWDCVWFGSYPQAEVVPSSEDYTALDKNLLQKGDLIINHMLYLTLQGATGWDERGDIVIGNEKYRRIKKDDATYSSTSTSYYNWKNATEYHYFKYQPIKWRVLSVNGSEAFLLADKALDDRQYHTEFEDVTWEGCTMRSWLNGYSASANIQNQDYSSNNFLDTAFGTSAQSAIKETAVENKDNLSYGTDGGNDTKDKVFLLSESEVYTDTAKKYGFVSNYDTYDEARRTKSSIFAKAMGIGSRTSGDYVGNCWWWLRSPGGDGNGATRVDNDGWVSRNHENVYYRNDGMRPALNLNLNASSDALSSNLWSYAGTVCSDGTVEESGGDTSGNHGSDGCLQLGKDSKNDITICAYDYDNIFSPVEGAEVSVEDFGTAVTDSTGKAVIKNTLSDKAMKTEKISVSKAGYRDYYFYKDIYNKDAELLWNSNYMSVSLRKKKEGDDTKPYISTMMCCTSYGRWYDALLSETRYEVSKTQQNAKFRICAVWNGKTPKAYVMYQKGGKSYSSKDGIFSLDMGQAFDAKKDVYVKITAEDGTVSEEKTALVIKGNSSAPSDGDTVDLLETDSTGTLGSDVALMSGADFKLDIKKVQMGVSIEKNKVRISIGGKPVKGSDFSNDSWSEWKKFCSDNKKDMNLSEWNDKIQDLKMNYGFGISANVKVVGYLEGALNDSGETILGGQIKLTSTVDLSVQTQYIVGVVPVYAKITFGADGSADGKFSYNYTKKLWDTKNCDLTLTLEPHLKAEGGVGVEAVASVGVEGSGTMTIKTKVFHKDNDSMDLKAKMALKVKLLMFEHSLTIAEKTWNLLPGDGNKKKSAKKIQMSDFELTERDSSVKSKWIGSSRAQKSSLKKGAGSGTEETVLETGVYENTETKLVQAGDTKMLFWLEDDTNRSTINGSKLVYSVYDNVKEEWSAPQAVDDDGTADFAPSVITDGEKIYVAWQNISKEFSDSAALEDVAKASTIAMSTWTKGSGFGSAITVSDTAWMAAAPEIGVDGAGKPYVAYIQNTESDFLLITGKNNIVYSVIDGSNVEKHSYLTDVGLITSLSTAFDGTYQFAYTVDKDADTSTINDREVVVNGVATDNEVMDSNPQFITAGNNVLCFWYQDGRLVMQEASGKEKVIYEDDSSAITDDFHILPGENGQMAMIWTAMDDKDKKQLEGIVYDKDSKTWSKTIQLSDVAASIYAPEGRIDSNGNLEVAYKRADDNSTDLCFYHKAGTVDLSVESAYADETELIPGKAAPVKVEVKNNGTKNVNGFFVNIDGAKTEFSDKIAPGESKVVTADYTVPGNLEFGTVNVAVEVNGDNNAGNDVYSMEIGYTELALNLTDNEYNDTHLVDIQVANESGVDTEGTLEVHKNAVDGEIIDSLDLGTLSREEVTNITYLWNGKSGTDLDGVDSLYFVAVSKKPERSTGNNFDLIGVKQIKKDSEDSTPTPIVTPSPTSKPPVRPNYPNVPSGPNTPVVTPTASPSAVPTLSPAPTVSPTVNPTTVPTIVPTVAPTPVFTETPEPTLKPTETPKATMKPSAKPKPSARPGTKDEDKTNSAKRIKKGSKVTDKKTKAVYKITGTGKNRTAEYTKSTRKNPSGISVPASVKLNGKNYKVTSVGKAAFKNSKKLKTVKLGKNVKKIGQQAFFGCTKLTNVSIGKNVTSIGANAFNKCTALTIITIPSKVNKIGTKAFYQCRRLRYFMVKTKKLTLENIGANAFGRGYGSPRVKTDKKIWKRYSNVFLLRGMSKRALFIIDPVKLIV